MESEYKFKTELHCHTAESSILCGKIPAEDLVKMYVDGGSSTMVVTDHYGGKHLKGQDNEYEIMKFLEGYNTAKVLNEPINVILGMELNFDANANDYLVYGITEEFIRSYPEMYKMDLVDFCDLAHENGLLVFQAHPFRNNLTVIRPGICDGIEGFNSHPRHDSRNDIAMAWAKKYDLQMISGSDAHRPQDVAISGIRTKEIVKTSEQLVEVLRNRDYEMIIV